MIVEIVSPNKGKCITTGKEFKINKLLIRKDRGGDIEYSVKDKFFQIACPKGTKHNAQVLDNGSININ